MVAVSTCPGADRSGPAKAAGVDTSVIEKIVLPACDGRGDSRMQAAKKLIMIGSRAFDPTVALLEDKRAAMRLAAMWTLGEIRDPRAAGPIADAGEDPDIRLAETAMAVLGRMQWTPTTTSQKAWHHVLNGRWQEAGKCGKAAVCPLVVAFMKDKGDNSQSIASALVATGDRRAVGLLMPAIKTRSPWLGCIVAKTIGRLGGAEAVKALVTILGEKDSPARFRRSRHGGCDGPGPIGRSPRRGAFGHGV